MANIKDRKGSLRLKFDESSGSEDETNANRIKVSVLFSSNQDVIAEVEVSENFLKQDHKICVQKYHSPISRDKPKHKIEVFLVEKKNTIPVNDVRNRRMADNLQTQRSSEEEEERIVIP